MSIGFQWGTHNQPVKRKKRSQVVGVASLPPGAGPVEGREKWDGVEDFPAEGSWAFGSMLGDLCQV